MATVSKCLKVIKSLDEQDTNDVLHALDSYIEQGMTPERAQNYAVMDALDNAHRDFHDIQDAIRRQHPDAFDKPDVLTQKANHINSMLKDASLKEIGATDDEINELYLAHAEGTKTNTKSSSANDNPPNRGVENDSGKPQQETNAQEWSSDKRTGEGISGQTDSNGVRSEPTVGASGADEPILTSHNRADLEAKDKQAKAPESDKAVADREADVPFTLNAKGEAKTDEMFTPKGDATESAKAKQTGKNKVWQKADNKVLEMQSDPDMTKPKVRNAAKKMLDDGVIDQRDYHNIDQILKDKGMAAEDALDELRASVKHSELQNKTLNLGTGTLYATPVVPVIKAVRDAIQSLYKHSDNPASKNARESFKGAIESITSSETNIKEKLAYVGKVAFIGEASAMRLIANARGSKALETVWQHLSDLGGVEGVKSKTFEDAYTEHINRSRNIIGDALARFDGDLPALDRIKALVENRRAINTRTEEGRAAKTIADLLDRENKALNDAGLPTPKHVDYFPRKVLVPKIVKNYNSFVKAATRAYMLDGMTRAEAVDAAEAWYKSSVMTNAGAIENPFSGDRAGGRPNVDFTKARSISKKAFDNSGIREFYDPNMTSVLDSYLRKSAKRIAFEQRFGGTELNPDKTVKTTHARYDAIIKQLWAEGNGALERYVHDTILNGTGQGNTAGANGRALVSVVRSIGIVQLLRKAVISSLGEGVQAYNRTAPMQGQVAGLKNAGRTYGNALFDLTQHLGMKNLTDAVGLKNHRLDRGEKYRMAELIGSILNDHVTGSAVHSKWDGLTDHDAVSSKIADSAQSFATAAVKASYLHDFTNSNIVDSTAIGRDFVREMTSQIGGSRGKLVEYELARLGLDTAQGKQLDRYIKLDKPIDEIISDMHNGDKMASMYVDTINRFQKQVIAQATSADKPSLAKHPYAQLAFGLQGWMTKYWYNMQRVNVKQVGMALTKGNGFTMSERASLSLTPIVSTALTYSIGAQLITGLRDLVSGKDHNEEFQQKQEESTILGMPIASIRRFSQASLFGIADPWVNRFTSARYGQDPVGGLGGAVISHGSKYLRAKIAEYSDTNSDDTNTQERSSAAAEYDFIVDPAIATLASVAPASKVSTFLSQRDELRESYIKMRAGEKEETDE